ncbi:restriction endonuclease subunit S [Acinetobacter baumannii]|nr:restriction endonuclease subunit S [Acinetobacter baumannii]
MDQFELPNGWVKGLLEQAVTVKSGVGFPHKFQGKLVGDFPVYKVGDLSKAFLENDGYLNRAGNYVTTDEAHQLKGEVFPIGSTLFAKIGEAVKLNRRVYVEVEGLADNNVMSVVPVIDVSARFIYYFMRTVDLTDVSRSTTVPSIRKGDIEQLPISWPPLAEQKVIADKLDTLLAQVDSIKARLERIPEILKQFRQSVLAAAVSGKLTEEWRGERNLPLWIDGILGQFIEKPSYGTSEKSQPAGDVPVLRMGNLQNGEVDWTDLVYTSNPEEISKYRLEPGDVLFNRTNSPELVGKTSIYRGQRAAIYAGYIIRVRCLPDLNSEFLNYHLNSPIGRDYCRMVKSDGVSQSNINAKKLADYPFSCPSIDEQVEIVKQVSKLFANADAIKQQVQSALDRVNNLTQSILAKAFRGELTADWREANPELISGENSAEALLERIKAERASVKPATKRGRGKA